MPIAQIVQILFLLIALLLIVYTFFPNWGPPVVISIPRIILLLVGLVVLYLIYLVVMSILVAAT